MNKEPISEHDHRVHALNIQGPFFERICQHIITQAPGWKVKRANYPVAFSSPSGKHEASALDIWAEYKKDGAILTLPIECKKHNPELASWIFFQHRKPTMSQNGGLPWITLIENIPRQAPNDGWDVNIRMDVLHPFICICTDEAREIRSSYTDYKKNEESKRKGGNHSQLTKTANHAITEACQQVALATKAIIHEENVYCNALRNKNDLRFPAPFKWQIFLPMIVTTAKLYSCNFDAADVDISTGEIPFDKVKIEEHPYLLYEYPLPRFLQSTLQDMASAIASDSWELFEESLIRSDILIVNSNAFSDVLSKLAAIIE